MLRLDILISRFDSIADEIVDLRNMFGLPDIRPVATESIGAAPTPSTIVFDIVSMI